MMAIQKVRVDVIRLAAAIEAKKKTLQDDYDKKLKAYNLLHAKWRKKAISEIRETLQYIENGGEISLGYMRSAQIKLSGDPPREPCEPSFTQMNRDLRILEISTEDTMLVNTDSSWVDYL